MSLWVGAASAAIIVTGNPAADGWTYEGRSLDAGTYIRGQGTMDYGVFSQNYTIDAGSNLLFSPNWQVGDTVIALGGVMNATLDVTFRSVTKFGGGTGNIYDASPDPALCRAQGVSGAACGHSRDDLGQGGEGSVLFGYNFVRNGGNVTAPGGNPWLLAPEVVRYRDGTEQNYDSDATVRDYGRIFAVFDTSGNDVVLRWEVFLNVSAFDRDARFNDLPLVGANSVVTFQRSTNTTEFVDALATPLPASSNGVPAPGVVLLLGAGLVGLAAVRRRRDPVAQ